MEWTDEIKEAMETLKTACNKNDKNEIWKGCTKCPFDMYCTILENEGMGIPGKWNIN